MIHKMHLEEQSLKKIKTGKKKFEIRIYDNKRRKVKINDFIIFENVSNEKEKIKVKVIALIIANCFEELYNLLSNQDKDIKKNKTWTKSCYQIYSKAEEKRFGVIAIKIKLIN